ncbi:MAG: hypothetical protein A2X56_11080 [Nitrospirae bacterium GWC2_57_13]|jgi:putative hydrolase of the HAD superfamily|nr:MAG: hypothetical protein A2X56_11080 [Nitrospirae bacterium GWC2_57_13]OGW40916.1 MAG: hypothetical protein A2X57_04260 [Nitrospirae bacterium GWD2_57_8]HAR46283.1 HAD family phosphatase [Nitrospiraceae bacterium]
MTDTIKAVLFDFGGVIAEEGFREGLLAIGRKNELDPEQFLRTADELVHDTGYVTGKADESEYWEAVRRRTHVSGADEELRREILGRFVLRPWMLSLSEMLRTQDTITAVLSDQTNWLDEIDQRTPFLHHFDLVYNSYYLGMSKREALIFDIVCAALDMQPAETLFIDDNPENVKRASDRGLAVITYRDEPSFREALGKFFPLLPFLL